MSLFQIHPHRDQRRNDSETRVDFRDSDSFLNLEDPAQRSEASRRVLCFKDVKGFKQLTSDIHEHYKFYKTLGKGSFGEVLLAQHIQA